MFNDFKSVQQVKLYPNPFGDFITIERELSMLSIFDVTGRRLKRVNLRDATQQVYTSSFSKVLYWYQVVNTNGLRKHHLRMNYHYLKK